MINKHYDESMKYYFEWDVYPLHHNCFQCLSKRPLSFINTVQGTRNAYWDRDDGLKPCQTAKIERCGGKIIPCT